MKEACEVLKYPVVSGNVSLYNETNGVAIPPTPAIGGVGLVPDLARTATHRAEGARATCWWPSAARRATSASRSIS